MGALLSSPVRAVVVERHGSEAYRAGLATMQGWRTGHEDGHHCFAPWKGDKDLANFAVFDGHGGTRIAEVASKMLGGEQERLNCPYDPEAVQETFLSLDRKLLNMVTQEESSGATCINCLVTREDVDGESVYTITAANLGDSRAVLVRPGASEEPEATEDHKPDNPEERQRIEAADGFVSPQNPARLDGVLSLSRAFGDFQYKQREDLPQAEQKVSPQPDIYTWKAAPNDVLVLCCDGIYDVMSNAEVATKVLELLSQTADLGEASQLLIEHCLALGSKDNMTAMIVLFADGTDHNSPPELKLGDFEQEEERGAVHEQYLKFARAHGFDLSSPQPCNICHRIFLDMSACPCKTAVYCGKECQKKDWKKHKVNCSAHQPKRNGAKGKK